jgi:hypothetical protein
LLAAKAHQAPVVPQIQVALQNGIRIAAHSTPAPGPKAQARIVPLIPAGLQNGTKIAAHSTQVQELKVQVSIALLIPVAPQIRTKGKTPTNRSAPIPRELLDNFAAREYRASP